LKLLTLCTKTDAPRYVHQVAKIGGVRSHVKMMSETVACVR
jgi:hypothetical protein